MVFTWRNTGLLLRGVVCLVLDKALFQQIFWCCFAFRVSCLCTMCWLDACCNYCCDQWKPSDGSQYVETLLPALGVAVCWQHLV